jgi:Putative DNA-binding domain
MTLALPELQRAFRTRIYGEKNHAPNYVNSAALHEMVVENGLSADARLGIYCNNTVSNLCNALKADYPVVERLVGGDFFRHAAKSYIAGSPSLSGDINDYGDDFPEFLAAFPAATNLPYLGDVARLERAWKQVFYAADAVAADFSSLAELPQDYLGDLHFQLHPALRLVTSPYPVMQIWRANQSDASIAEEICLDGQPEHVLLRRINGQVEMVLLTLAEYEWLAALSSGGNLADAVDAAFSRQDDFDLAVCLQRHLAQGSFIAYTLEK